MPNETGVAPTRRRLAVLIDGDNAQPSLIDPMLEESSRHGVPTVRRVYGDWTSQRMEGWKKVMHVHAVQPIQQFRYVAGKNSTDAAMIIDAMDVLYARNVDGFVLISSDSDYTRLATRLREAGMFVMGIGEKKTPAPLVKACELFVYTENLAAAQRQRRGRRAERPAARAPEEPASEDDLEDLLGRAFDLVEEEDGWTHLGRMGEALLKIDPGFDPRTYGSTRLLDLIQRSKDLFDIRQDKAGGRSQVYVRRRD